MNVLIIPDKFKGTLTARQAGDAIAQGWRSVRPDDRLEILPMSDGGDGFGEIIGGMMGGAEVKVETVDAAHRPHLASFWWQAETQTAVLEAAQVNGLALLPPGRFHPFDLDTFGLGHVYRTAAALGAQKIMVGIGGSATNDAGFGFARSLGWNFRDSSGAEISRWTDLELLSAVEPPKNATIIPTTVAVDVQNPLLGPQGCSRIYGPQKGLREEDMVKSEACLGRLAEVIHLLNENALPGLRSTPPTHRPPDLAELPGAGAAGGLGYGLAAFLGARFISGADLFAEAANLDRRLESAHCVISGEGSIDSQSLMGKGVGSLFERCRAAGVHRIGLAGSLGPGVQEAFAHDRHLQLLAIVPTLATVEDALAQPTHWLTQLAASAAKSAVPR